MARVARGGKRWRGKTLEVYIPIPGQARKGGGQKYAYEYVHLGDMTRTEAERIGEAKLAELRVKFNRGTYEPKQARTVGDAVKAWFDGYVEERFKSGQIRKRSREWYDANIRNHIDPLAVNFDGREMLFTKIPLQKLKANDLDRAYTRMMQKGVHETTVAGVHRTIRAALNYAVGEQWIMVNPADHVRNPPSQSGKPHPVLEPETASTLLAAAETDSLRAYHIIQAIIFTGLRLSEILGLQRQDLNFEKGLIRVERQLTRGGPNTEFGPIKTKAGYRTVPMPEELAETLKQAMAERDRDREEAARKGVDYTDRNLIFATNNGNGIWRQNVSQRELKRILDNAGLKDTLKDFREHDLRHSFASIIHDLGGSTKLLASLLGHASEKTTNGYTHPSLKARRDAVERLAEAVKPAPTQETP